MDHFERELARIMRDAQEYTPLSPRTVTDSGRASSSAAGSARRRGPWAPYWWPPGSASACSCCRTRRTATSPRPRAAARDRLLLPDHHAVTDQALQRSSHRVGPQHAHCTDHAHGTDHDRERCRELELGRRRSLRDRDRQSSGHRPGLADREYHAVGAGDDDPRAVVVRQHGRRRVAAAHRPPSHTVVPAAPLPNRRTAPYPSSAQTYSVIAAPP